MRLAQCLVHIIPSEAWAIITNSTISVEVGLDRVFVTHITNYLLVFLILSFFY